MTDPIIFPSSSPRLALPCLFAGQAQKEMFVNEAHARIDALLHAAIEGTADAPPIDPIEGQGWRVGISPTGAWTGQAEALAFRQGGNWIFVIPCDGMRVLDRSTGQDIRYVGGWLSPSPPESPNGGATIDSEARLGLEALIAKLCEAGVFPTIF